MVDPAGASNPERTLLATLQGLVNKKVAVVWIASGGMQEVLLKELESEGIPLERVKSVWDLLRIFKPRVKGCVVYAAGNRSINIATGLCGSLGGVAIEKSILDQARNAGLAVLQDVSACDDPEKAYAQFGDRFAKGLLIEQSPDKKWQLRDFAVQRNAFVIWDVPSKVRTQFARDLASGALVYGWGRDEHTWVRDVSSGGASGIPSDWSVNLSALSFLRVDIPDPPPLEEPAPVREGERVVAFVMSDGDNVQWLGNNFATDARYWASPHRGAFNMSWEMAPVLPELAPRILRHFRRTASRGPFVDEFIAGPSGIGYAFHNCLPDRKVFARQTVDAMKKSGLRVVTLLNSGGDMSQSRELLEEPDVLGVVYKDYAPYNKRRGEIFWHRGKPCVSYRFLLWEPDRDQSPRGVAEAVAKLPSAPATDANSYALVNVHAWSWNSIGGPMEAVKQTIDLLPPKTRVVTVSELLLILQKNLGKSEAER